MRSPIAAIFLLLTFLHSAALAAPWYSSSVTGGATIYASASGPGQFVFVGGSGLIATSADGTTWTRRTSGTTVTLFGVAYGAGRFVAVGERGTILSSTDGITWAAESHPYALPLAPDINGVTFANGRFLAASRSLSADATDNIIVSTDGRAWTRRTVDRPGFQMQFVAYANGQYVAGGGGILLVSADTISWRTVWTGGSWLYSAAHNGARWVVSGLDGTLLTSSDGDTWTAATTGQRQTFFAIGTRNGRFLGVGTNPYTIQGNTASVFSSADGLTWQALPFPGTSAITRNDVVRSLLPTATGYLAFGASGLIAATLDGSAWTVSGEFGGRAHFTGAVYANGLFVAVGSKAVNGDTSGGLNPGRAGAVFTSTDGWNWEEQDSGLRGYILRDVAYGSGRFVAVGTGGKIIYSDDNAVTWKSATLPVSSSFLGVAYGAGRFVAIGNGTLTSLDGITWQAETNAATAGKDFWTIRYVNDAFYLSGIGNNISILRSFDGVNWTTVTLAGSSALNDIAFANGLWVAAASSGSTVSENGGFVATGLLQISTDGLRWEAVRCPYVGSMTAVKWLGDRWVAGSSDGTILTSPDARNWRIEERPTDNTINAIVANAEYAVAVGNNHTQLTTRDPRTVPVRQSVALGQPLTLTVAATGTPAPTIRWFKDEVAITGATSATYSVASAAALDAGTYAAVVTAPGGAVTRTTFAVTVLASHIVNLSIRSSVTAAIPELAVGFVVSGADKPLLIRAAGPGLTQFGVNPVLALPGLGVYAGPTLLVANDGWDRVASAGAQVTTASARLGAFPFAPGSADAAVLHTFGAGSHSAVVRSHGGATGTVLLEIYDADTTLRSRLINVSTLARVGAGADILAAGFVVRGNTPKRVLIRAIGPGLAAFGRPGTLADPQLSITTTGGQTALAVNDNWGGTLALSDAFRSVNAFPLSNDSKDAAVVLSLAPGGYSVQVSGFGGTTGDALLEVYELP